MSGTVRQQDSAVDRLIKAVDTGNPWPRSKPYGEPSSLRAELMSVS
jgi:hypothetical protein